MNSTAATKASDKIPNYYLLLLYIKKAFGILKTQNKTKIYIQHPTGVTATRVITFGFTIKTCNCLMKVPFNKQN